MAAKALRIGIIGAGGIVLQRHLPGLKSIPGIKIRAVANSTLASAQRFCEKHAPEADAVADWRDLVNRPDIDIVWIGAPPCLHKTTTLAALAAKKHVFCQARMAMNLAEGREMLAVAKAYPGCVTMLCPAPHKGDTFFKKLLTERIAGELRMIRLKSLHGGFLDPDKPAHWRQRREISGLNIMTLGINIEALHLWFGDIMSVKASGKVFIKQRGDYKVEIPDVLNVLLEFENGALGALEFSSIYPGNPVDGIEVAGSLGVLRYDFAKDVISFQRAGEPAPKILTVPPELVQEWNVEKDFIHAVRNPGSHRPYPTFEDGVAYMAVVQAVNDSLLSGKRVLIPQVPPSGVH